MQGVRRPDGTQAHELAAGEYALTADGTGVWICDPRGVHGCVDKRWTVVVEDDDSITVDPSIWTNAHGSPPGWHGFLKRGVWSEV